MRRGWLDLSQISVTWYWRFVSITLMPCLVFFSFPLWPILASPHTSPVQPLPPVFPREGEVNWSEQELRKELRAEQKCKVLWLIELKHGSIVSSALKAIKWKAAEHKHVVMTMSVIKNGGFCACLMCWEKGNQDSTEHLIDFTVLSKAAQRLKCNHSSDKLSVTD